MIIMGKEDEKDKEKDKDKNKYKDKDKDKDKKKDKDKDKDKDKKKDKEKEKDKDKDKDKKKDKEKEKDKFMPDQEWKILISKNLDEIIGAYGKIVKLFQDVDNYILKDAKTVEEFKEKVLKMIADLPEHQQNAFTAFLDTVQ